MSVTMFTEVDETLVLLAESRERAERAAKIVASEDGAAHIVAALEMVDRELLALHRRLLEETVLHVPGSVTQLVLDAA